MGEGVANRMVQRDAALQKHFLSHIARALHSIEIITDDGIDQSGHNVVTWVPPLLRDANIRVDEGGAGRLEMDRRRRVQGDVRNFRHLYAQISVSTLLEERAGSRRTGVVHGIVDGNPVAQINIFGILPTDFKNRVHTGIKMVRPRSVSRDFVVDIFGAQIGPDKFSC